MRKPADFDAHPYDLAQPRAASGFPQYRAMCKYVTDGDTFDFLIDLGLYQYAYDTVRLRGFDAPETFHPQSEAERLHGLATTARARRLIEGKPVYLVTYRDTQSFGRFIADVYYWDRGQWKDVAATLRAEGLAKREEY